MQHSPDTNTSAGTKAIGVLVNTVGTCPGFRLSTRDFAPAQTPGRAFWTAEPGLPSPRPLPRPWASCPLCRNERVVHNEELRTSGYVHFANFSRKQSGISMGPFG